MGLSLIVAGHYHTEAPICRTLADMLQSLVSSASIEVYGSNTIQTILN
jgi:putative NIF3 family GTP cyclohydrolase 1 type 2